MKCEDTKDSLKNVPTQGGTKLQYANSPNAVKIDINTNSNRMIALCSSIAQLMEYYGGVNDKTLADIVKVVNLLDTGQMQ